MHYKSMDSTQLSSETPLSMSPCPTCHIQIRVTDYFCFNCGKKLKPQPLSTTIIQQLIIYVSSVFLPPIGIIWGIRYIKEKNLTAKIIGIISIILTVIVLVVSVYIVINVINTVNSQINTQVENILQF